MAHRILSSLNVKKAAPFFVKVTVHHHCRDLNGTFQVAGFRGAGVSLHQTDEKSGPIDQQRRCIAGSGGGIDMPEVACVRLAINMVEEIQAYAA